MLSHINAQNQPAMVNVGEKAVTRRTAHAVALVHLPADLARLIVSNEISSKKGPVFQTATLAGIMGAKKTSDLIPLCHPLPLSQVVVTIEPHDSMPGFRVTAEARTRAATGVEMEALTAVSVASLTLFDMLKAIDRSMVIGDIRVVSKSGGKSGDWTVDVP